MMQHDPSRRTFLQAAAASAALPFFGAHASAAAPNKKPFVGVQIHPFSFYDEGPERVLDLLQETAGVNALLIYTHLYAADQSVPKEVLAHDHPGFTPVEPKSRRYRRVWVRHSENAFRDSLLQHPQSEKDVEYAGKDLFAELEPLCERRGMKLMGRILEPRGVNYTNVIQNFSEALVVDIHGQRGANACWNNPDYRAFWQTTVADAFRNNPLEGFMVGAERTGPLYRLIQSGEPPSCFCRHCRQRMSNHHVDEQRLRDGYAALSDWILAMRRDPRRPADGALITFLRLVMRHPEVLVWERQWALSLEEAIASLAGAVKSVHPDALVGRHIDHQQTTWDLFYRAAVTYGEMAETVDFLKPVVYHDIAAPRVRQWFIGEFGKSLFADLSQPQALDLYYAVFGLDPRKEPALEAMLHGGFSPDYIYRETKRCVDGVAGRTLVYPGIGFDIPFHRPDAPPRPHPSDPAVLAEATRKAFEAGAKGIVVCREYQEMRMPNLRAIGQAIAEIHG
jgi:hypothetical protein